MKEHSYLYEIHSIPKRQLTPELFLTNLYYPLKPKHTMLSVPEKTQKPEKDLCDILKCFGFYTHKTLSKTFYYIVSDTNAKEEFFADACDEFKNHINDLSINDFIDQQFSQTLQDILVQTDHFTDRIWYNDTVMTISEFIRQMDDKTPYYIGNVLLMERELQEGVK